MNRQRYTQFISYTLTASCLLSFWICVEGCRAEVENDFENRHSISQTVHVEDTEEDFCAVRTAPSALFSNPDSLIPANVSELQSHSRNIVSHHKTAPNPARQTEKTFLKSPIQILRQLRI